jgi:hypothetical protein
MYLLGHVQEIPGSDIRTKASVSILVAFFPWILISLTDSWNPNALAMVDCRVNKHTRPRLGYHRWVARVIDRT